MRTGGAGPRCGAREGASLEPMLPFYDPRLSYDENYRRGPWGAFAAPASAASLDGAPSDTFLDLPVTSRFGIPAGPLLNARYCEAAFAHGFDLNVYKTVRSRPWPAHAHPNVLAVHVDGQLASARTPPVLLADGHLVAPPASVSITNSFGVPSAPPDVWQPDMARAVAAAGPGQLLVGSFQGTRSVTGGEAAYIADHATTAALVAQTGAHALELNLSCPNEGAASLLCFDTPRVVRVLDAIRARIGDVPLLIKLARFHDDDALAAFVRATAHLVDGYAAINTLPARLVDAHGAPALPGPGREVGGVCGDAIAGAARDMVARLARLRDSGVHEGVIVGVGGAGTPERYLALRDAGADAVMSATGAMFNPVLAREIKAALAGV